MLVEELWAKTDTGVNVATDSKQQHARIPINRFIVISVLVSNTIACIGAISMP
jgi:hypothetical protein